MARLIKSKAFTLDKLRRALAPPNDYTAVLNLIYREFLAIENMRFQNNGMASGKGIGSYPRWAPLKPSYAKRKEKKYPGRPILVASGKLGRAATGGAGSFKIMGPTFAAFGVMADKVKFAPFHMTGTKNMKPRPFLEANEATVTTWKELIRRYILRRKGVK